MNKNNQLIGALRASSAAPIALKVVLSPEVGNRVSPKHSKYTPQQGLIVSVQETTIAPIVVEPAEPKEATAKTPAKTAVKDSFLVKLMVDLPNGQSHQLDSFEFEGTGTKEFSACGLPVDWYLIVETKSRSVYSIYGY